jgi:hypothetical protein
MLVIGGLLVFVVIIIAGLVVVLPLLDENPGISSGGISVPEGQIPSGDNGPSADSSGSGVSGSGENPASSSFAMTTTSGFSQPAQSGSSSSPDDFIIGTWDLGSTVMRMQFGADGMATLRDSTSGYSATLSWERIANGKYRLRSPSGVESPILISDPLAGIMYFEDYSTVFIREA